MVSIANNCSFNIQWDNFSDKSVLYIHLMSKSVTEYVESTDQAFLYDKEYVRIVLGGWGGKKSTVTGFGPYSGRGEERK